MCGERRAVPGERSMVAFDRQRRQRTQRIGFLAIPGKDRLHACSEFVQLGLCAVHAKQGGKVLLSCAWSLPAVLPSCSELASTSRMSSRTWKARPSASAKLSSWASCGSWAWPHSAPMRTAARIRAPVFSACMRVNAASVCCWPVASISRAWPPHMPDAPEAWARVCRQATRSVAGSGASASRPKARVCSASPARIAVASSKAMWVVGLPRRSASSSIAGRSSCTSE